MKTTITTIATTTRTGRKVHRITVGSSTTHCGVWLRRSDGAYAVDRPVDCKSCLGSDYLPGITFTDEGTATSQEQTGTFAIRADEVQVGDKIAGREITAVLDEGNGILLLTTGNPEWRGGFRKPKVAVVTVTR